MTRGGGGGPRLSIYTLLSIVGAVVNWREWRGISRKNSVWKNIKAVFFFFFSAHLRLGMIRRNILLFQLCCEDFGFFLQSPSPFPNAQKRGRGRGAFFLRPLQLDFFWVAEQQEMGTLGPGHAMPPHFFFGREGGKALGALFTNIFFSRKKGERGKEEPKKKVGPSKRETKKIERCLCAMAFCCKI